MWWRVGLVTLVISGLAVAVNAKSLTGNNNLTGNDYQQFTVEMKISYAIGLFQGLVIASIQAAAPAPAPGWKMLTLPEATTKQPAPAVALFGCLSPMTVGQIRAILEKYLADNPSVWHHELGEIANNAVVDACSKR